MLALVLLFVAVQGAQACSFQVSNVGKGGQVVNLYESCFPDGPLKVGDVVSMNGFQPDCCPPALEGLPNASVYSVSVFSQDKNAIIHFAVKRSWQQFAFATALTGGWGQWTREVFYPLAFAPNMGFTLDIQINQANIAFVTNNQIYTYRHPVANPENFYYTIGLGIDNTFYIAQVYLTRNGVRTFIDLGAIDFYG